MSEPNWTTRSIDGATDLTKQILTLTTGVLALTVTFYSAFFPKPANGALAPPPNAKHLLAIAWVVFIVSILVGILVLGSVTGTQAQKAVLVDDPTSEKAKKITQRLTKNRVTAPFVPSISSATTKWLSISQWILFVIGLGLVVAAAILALR